VNALAGTYNATVDAVSWGGWTALMHAAKYGHTDVVNALAGTYNANVDAVAQNGWTALMHAAGSERPDDDFVRSYIVQKIGICRATAAPFSLYGYADDRRGIRTPDLQIVPL
jgi:hypothetical protein